jgi:hypothetical protein
MNSPIGNTIAYSEGLGMCLCGLMNGLKSFFTTSERRISRLTALIFIFVSKKKSKTAIAKLLPERSGLRDNPTALSHIHTVFDGAEYFSKVLQFTTDLTRLL